jgi:hypothetical protein
VWFNSIRLEQEGPDRVRVHNARGAAGPEQTKVAVNYLGGYRNSMTFVLTGLAVEQKAAVAERTLWSLVEGGRESFEAVDVQLSRSDRDNPATNEEAHSYLRITVMDQDEAKVGRAFSNKVIEMVLASYPGLFTTTSPTGASSFGVYWPALIPADFAYHTAVIGDERIAIPPAPAAPPLTVRRQRKVGPEGPAPKADTATPMLPSDPESLATLFDDLSRQRLVTETDDSPYWDEIDTAPASLGLVMGARSGDKGGNANVGVWTRTDDGYDWIQWFLTVERLRTLMPAETEGLDVTRVELPNLRALNFVIKGLLGRGVAASTRTDPQAKGLGEYLRAKLADVPITLLAGSLEATDRV